MGDRRRRNEYAVTTRNDSDDQAAKTEAIIRRTNACPYYQLLGMRVAELGTGYARIHLPAATKLHQPFGFVHGGAVSSVVDAAGGLALTSLLSLDERAVTVELKVNYLAAVRDGELSGEGRVVHRGSRIAVVDVEVHGGAEKLVAKALGTFVIGR